MIEVPILSNYSELVIAKASHVGKMYCDLTELGYNKD